MPNNPYTLDPLILKQNALRLAISEDVALAYNVQYPTLVALKKLFATQRQLKWNADVGGAGTRVKDVTEPAIKGDKGAIESADLPIGQTADTYTFDILLTDVTEAASAGVDAVKNLFQGHVNRGLIKIRRDLNQWLYTGDGTKPFSRMIGMEKVIDNTYAYAGIDPVAAPGWTSVVAVGTGTTLRDLTPDLLTNFEKRLMLAETSYDVIFCHPDLVERYKNLFNANRSYSSTGSSPQSVDIGLSDVYYNNRPIIQDPACTANTLYFVDSSEVEFYTYRVKEDAVNGGMAIKMGMLSQNNIYSETWEIGVIPQLKVHSRKAVNALRYVK